MTEPTGEEASTRLAAEEQRIEAVAREAIASSDGEGGNDAAGKQDGQEQLINEQQHRREAGPETGKGDDAWHGSMTEAMQPHPQVQTNEQERRQTTTTTPAAITVTAEGGQHNEGPNKRDKPVGDGSELDTSTDTTGSRSASRQVGPGVTTSGVVTPVRLVESSMEAPSPIPYVPDDTVMGELNSKDTVAISYGNVVHSFQTGKKLTAQQVLGAFGLPAITEFQIRDDAGDEIDLGSARLHRNLSLVVRRSRRRRKRTADARIQRSVLRRDLDAGMALLEEKQAMMTDGYDETTTALTWEQFRYALRSEVEDGFRKSISLSRLSQTSTQSRRRASTISVSNPTQDTQQITARPSQVEQSSRTFEADYAPPKTLVIMFSAQGFGFSCRRLCVMNEKSVSTTSSSQESVRGTRKRLTLMEMDESLILPEEAMTSKTFISTVLSGSTAELAGLQAGDLIHKINDSPVDEMSLDEVHSLLTSCQSDLVLWASCIQKGRVDDEDEEGNQTLNSASMSRVASFFGDPAHPEASFLYEVTRAGTVQVKIVREGGGKKMRKRPWKEYMAALRGHVLYLYSSKDRMDGPLGHRPAGGRFNVKSALADIAYDYKKRKHVFRLQTFNGAVCLIQANSHGDMLAWIRAVQENNNPDKDDAMQNDLIKRKVSQMSRNPSSPSVASPYGLRAERHSAHSLPSRASSSGVSPQPTLRNLWHMPRLKRKSSSVETGLATYAFASSITDLCLRHRVRVPLLVTKLVSEIERRGLDEEGLYRQSGSTSQIQRVKERLSRDPDATDLTDTDTFFDLHALCGALKDYFRSISPPIFTSGLYEKFIACARLSGENRLHVLKDLLTQLPPEHHTTLQFVMQHLKRLVEHSDKNKMSASNVAVCFGPTLVRTDADIDGATLMHNTGPQNKLVQLLVSNCEFLFEAEGHEASGVEADDVTPHAEEDEGEDASTAFADGHTAHKHGACAASASSARGETTLGASQQSAAQVPAASPHDYAGPADMLAFLAGTIPSLPVQDTHGASTDDATDDDTEGGDGGRRSGRSTRRARERFRRGSHDSDEHMPQNVGGDENDAGDGGDGADTAKTDAHTSTSTSTSTAVAAAAAASEVAREGVTGAHGDSDKRQQGLGPDGPTDASDSVDGDGTESVCAGSESGYLEVRGCGRSQQRATSEPARSQRPADETPSADSTAGSLQQGSGLHPTTPPRKNVRASGEQAAESSPRLDRPRSVPRRRRDGRRSGSLPLETAGTIKTPHELHRRGTAARGEDEAERRRESSIALSALLSASTAAQQAAPTNSSGGSGAGADEDGGAAVGRAAGQEKGQEQRQQDQQEHSAFQATGETPSTRTAPGGTSPAAATTSAASTSSSRKEGQRAADGVKPQGGPVKVEQARHRALEVLSEFDRAFCEFETREDIQALHRAGTPVDDFFLEEGDEDERETKDAGQVADVHGDDISKPNGEQQQQQQADGGGGKEGVGGAEGNDAASTGVQDWEAEQDTQADEEHKESKSACVASGLRGVHAGGQQQAPEQHHQRQDTRQGGTAPQDEQAGDDDDASRVKDDGSHESWSSPLSTGESASRPLQLLVSRPRRLEEFSHSHSRQQRQRAREGNTSSDGAEVPKRPSYEAALTNPSAETPNVPERQFRVMERPRRKVGPTTSGMAQLRETTDTSQPQQQPQQSRGVTLARPPPSYHTVDRAQRLVLRRDGKTFATSSRESTI